MHVTISVVGTSLDNKIEALPSGYVGRQGYTSGLQRGGGERRYGLACSCCISLSKLGFTYERSEETNGSPLPLPLGLYL